MIGALIMGTLLAASLVLAGMLVIYPSLTWWDDE